MSGIERAREFPGTSVAANYRAACRARSVAEEADETLFWLELPVEADLVQAKVVGSLLVECEELVKIFSASLATAKANR